MTRAIFSIGADLLALNDLLDETGGELTTPEADTAVSAWLAELHTEQAAKLDGYVGLIRTLEMEASAATAEAEQYAKKAGTRTNRVKWLKRRMKDHLEATGQLKATTVTGRVLAIQKNGGVFPLDLAETLRPDDLEERFRKVTVTIDTDAVRKALETGEAVPGACLRERGTHLRIR